MPFGQDVLPPAAGGSNRLKTFFPLPQYPITPSIYAIMPSPGLIPTLVVKIFRKNSRYPTLVVQIFKKIFHPKIQPLVY
jgi:hypothetical protein